MTCTTEVLESKMESNPAPSEMAQGWAGALIVTGVALVTVLILHGETVGNAVAVWNTSETYRFGWMVLPTLGYLLWHNRLRIAAYVPTGNLFGVLVSLLCSLAWIASDFIDIGEGRQLALVASLCAVILTAVGWSAFRALTPFLVMLVFLAPTGGFLLTPLKNLTVSFAEGFAAVSGIPFAADGFTIFIGAQRYVVVDDCAGLPYLLIGLFLGLTLALLIYRSWWRIAAMTLLGGVLAILANGIRVIGIIVYDYLTGAELDLVGHIYFERFAIGLCFVTLFVIFARLSPERSLGRSTPDPGGPSMPISRYLGLLLLAVALIAAGPLISRSSADAHGTTEAEVLPATDLSGWRMQSATSEWQPQSRLESTAVSLATYNRGDRTISVFVAQARSPEDKLNRVGINLNGGVGWMRGNQQRISVCTDDWCRDIVHMTFLLKDSRRERHVYSAYAVGHNTMTSPLALRLRRAWARVRGTAEPARLIAIATEGPSGLPRQEIASVLQALVRG